MNKLKGLVFGVFLSCTAAPLLADEQPMLINVKRMSMETALTMAKGAIDACRKEQIQISVTVVDRAGVTQVALRDVLAPTVSLTISEQKARAALAFNVKTADMEGRFKNFGSVAKTDGLIFSAGGVPVNAGGRILGAVGVSGAPSGKLDEKCAQAGIDTVLDELEMAD
ncbi:MAG: heme-binding protein [Gammaproteobacteria bacterium]|nr:heme-binding protein [Gammaproteobacteria bacterium]